MSALYELVERPTLSAPLLVLALDGWIDAGLGAQNARAALLESTATTVVARFDADELLDHRARRPSMVLEDGILTSLNWPSIELRAGTDADGNDVLLLSGAEPDHRWRAFADAVVELAAGFGTRIVAGIGAYPAPVPHTRPSRLASAASNEELAARVAVRSTIEVPAGIQGAIEHGAAQAGIPAVGLWAQVPHYVSAMPYPNASAALVEGVCSVGGVRLDATELHRQGEAMCRRIDDLIAGNPEHREMVRQLEVAWDEEEGAGQPPEMSGPLPSGDELAAEVERFLREQGS